MTFPLPTYSGPAASWHQIDWTERTFTTGKAGSDGLATFTAEQLAPGTQWLIDHAVVQCSSVAPTLFRLYVGQATAGGLRDGSAEGNFDVADWPSGLLLRPSAVLIGQWSGCTAGAVGVLTLQARVYEQG